MAPGNGTAILVLRFRDGDDLVGGIKDRYRYRGSRCVGVDRGFSENSKGKY